MAPNGSKWLEIPPNGLKCLQKASKVLNNLKKMLKGAKVSGVEVWSKEKIKSELAKL